jgi:hypothetical protein
MGKRSGEIVGQHASPGRTQGSQQIGDAADLATLGPQHFHVESRNLGFRGGDRTDRVGIGVGCRTKRGIIDRQRPHGLRQLLGARRIARQQRRGDLILCPEQAPGDGPVRHLGDCLLEPLAQGRQRRDLLGAARDQCGNMIDSGAVVRKPLHQAVDHVLLLWRELQPRLLQKRAQRRHRLPDPIGPGAGIGDEIAGRQPQLVHAPLDLLGDIAKALQALQLGKGRTDVADGNDAGDAGHHDHRQQQHETGEGQLTDRKRERPYPSDDGGKGHGFSGPAPSKPLLYDGNCPLGNLPAAAPQRRRRRSGTIIERWRPHAARFGLNPRCRRP